MSNTEILIAGAGPTGLVLALQLARRGVAFRIIDKASGPGLASRAMAVHARTLELYQQLGIADAVVAAGIKMQTIHLREDGVEITAIRLGDIGEGMSPFPFVLCYPQDDHERLLVGVLEGLGVTIEWNAELARFTQNDAGVRAVLVKDGVEEPCEAAYICGCDGAHSRVRHELDLEFPGGDYEQPFFVADVEIENPPGEDLLVNMGADSFGLMLPVRSSGAWRLIGAVPLPLAERTDLTFEDLRASAEKVFAVRVTAVNWFSAYHVHHRVASHFQVGRAFLAGDAGHIHSPAGGQGMNTGIGDAINLGWKLAEVVAGRADRSLLETYEVERIAFARLLVATTDTVFRAVVSRGLGAEFMRGWLLPKLAPLATGFSAVRRAMFNTVSQIRIEYRRSTLSEGHAGHVHGGDRLPWVAGDGGGNFASLQGLNWRVHVYGAVDPAFATAATGLGLGVDGFGWSEAAKDAGFTRDAAYVVRPDGYVGLALAEQDAGKLAAYLAARRLKLR